MYIIHNCIYSLFVKEVRSYTTKLQLDSRSTRAKNQILRACLPDINDRDYFSETLDRPPDRSPPLLRSLSGRGFFGKNFRIPANF